MPEYRTDRRTRKVHPIIAPLSRSKLESEGREEAERFEGRLGKSFDGRIIDEIRDYNERYGIASPADVATEINSRGKDLVFQGELYYYAYKDLGKIEKRMEKLAELGLLKKVKVAGAKDGYVVSGSRSKTRTRTRKTRYEPKAIMDFEPEDL